jgi:hypothetical protein
MHTGTFGNVVAFLCWNCGATGTYIGSGTTVRLERIAWDKPSAVVDGE